jgi:hypothetical protein
LERKSRRLKSGRNSRAGCSLSCKAELEAEVGIRDMKVVAVVGRSLMASYKIEATRKAGWFEG